MPCSKGNAAKSAPTAAANKSTGTFYCSGGAHYVRGTPLKIGKRNFCERCAAKRRTKK